MQFRFQNWSRPVPEPEPKPAGASPVPVPHMEKPGIAIFRTGTLGSKTMAGSTSICSILDYIWVNKFELEKFYSRKKLILAMKVKLLFIGDLR